MNLIIKCNVKLGNDAAQTPEDVKTEILDSLKGLFDDVSFISSGDQVETIQNIIDYNGNKVGVISLETKKGDL